MIAGALVSLLIFVLEVAFDGSRDMQLTTGIIFNIWSATAFVIQEIKRLSK